MNASNHPVPGIAAIAAVLHFNDVSPERGYDIFDVDKDGKISLKDLQEAASSLHMETSFEDVNRLFEVLDEDCDGFVDRCEHVCARAQTDTHNKQTVEVCSL